jgi:serum/glucocorticoid-regulated kinase 2
MEFMQGGELFQHLRRQKRFTEPQAKFYAACITLGLGHLHNKNYIYRDLKLENLLLDEQGYAKLTDFGLAKFIEKDEVALTFCGTPEYLSPEVILGKGHNRPADWWSLGVLIYEMLYGIPPFYSSDMQTMYRKAVKDKVVFKSSPQISDNAKDIINKLLIKNQKNRLGSQADSLEVLAHPWFDDLDWSKLLEKSIKAPFIPEVKGDNWLKNFDDEFTKEEARDSIAKVDLNKLQKFQKEFAELNYNIDDDKN